MPGSSPEGSIDKVLQPDGTYKWEVVPHPRAEDLNPPVKKVSKPKAAPKPKAPKTTFNNSAAE